MKRKRVLSVVLLVFVLVTSFSMRLVDLVIYDHDMQTFGEYYKLALVGDAGIYCIKNFSLNEIYTVLLSVMMYMLGNGELAAIMLNMICQLFIIVLIYVLILEWSNIYISGIVAMGTSVVLLFTGKMYEVSGFHIYMIAILLLLCVIWIIAKILYLKKRNNTLKPQKSGDICANDEINTVITLDDILGKEIKEKEPETLVVSENLQEAPKGMKEIQMAEVEKNVTQFIENPLPVPKRKEHKQMDYAIDTLNENDDFDIKDMTGIDFYDVE